MKNVKWIFVVLLTSSLTSFMEKDKSFSGLSVGDTAPKISIESIDLEKSVSTSMKESKLDLASRKGKYVILSFWASYDADSRIQNIQLNNVLKSFPNENIEIVSFSFDEYESVFEETLRKDKIATSNAFFVLNGVDSKIYKDYKLDQGFGSYLLNQDGIILAKNFSVDDLPLLTSALN